MGGGAVLDTCAINDGDNAFSHTAQVQILTSSFLWGEILGNGGLCCRFMPTYLKI